MEERALLIVDDEDNILTSLKRTLRQEDYKVFTANNGYDALRILGKETIQVILCDQRMPNMTGSIFLSLVKKIYPDTVRIILSGYTDFSALADAVNHGEISKFITKPWDDQEIKGHIDDAFRRQNQIIEFNKLPTTQEIQEAIMITDTKNIIQSINHNFCNITQYDHTESLGIRLLLIDKPDDEEKVLEAILNTGQWTGAMDIRCKNGTIIQTWLSITAIPDQKGVPQEYIHAFHDIQQEKRLYASN